MKPIRETELVSSGRSEPLTPITPTDVDPLDENEDNEENDETETLLPSQPVVLLPEERKLLQSSLSDDLFAVFYDMRFIAPFTALLFGLIGAYLVIDPFAKIPARPSPMSHAEYVSPFFLPPLFVHPLTYPL
jgi:hypothetical protein